MTVKVLFFGVLAEVTGTNCKHYSEAKSLSALTRLIQDELNDGDEVAFMPPFAGG